MNKELMKTVIKALPIIAIFILLISGTFAKYSFAGSSDVNTGIAGWNVQIKSDNNDLTLLDETQVIKFEVQNNPYVVKNKIAPGVTAIGTVDIDLVGTEVAVDINVDIDTQGLDKNCFDIITKLDGEILNNGTKFIPLENDRAFTTENGKKTITIELTWKADKEISTSSIIGDNISFPVTITVEQHI